MVAHCDRWDGPMILDPFTLLLWCVLYVSLSGATTSTRIMRHGAVVWDGSL